MKYAKTSDLPVVLEKVECRVDKKRFSIEIKGLILDCNLEQFAHA